jgi:superfamily II DNA or RNA helicase
MSELTQDQITEFYGEKELRWAQVACKNGTINAIAEGVRRVLIVLPTGVGKTITIAALLDSPEMHKALKIEEERPLRVLFLAHVHRLLTQAERTFAEANNVDIKISTPFSQIPQDDIDWADIVVIDEAHHEAMMSIQYQLDTLSAKPIVGLTATKDRADSMLLKFEVIIEPITREQAVAEGWIAETSIWSFVDTSGKDKSTIVNDIAKNYGESMGGTMCFMATKREVQAVADYVNSLGLRAVALTNQTKQQVDMILDQFSRGEIDWVVNCSRIGEGVDTKGCTSVVIGRNLNSYSLLNQIIGRSARPDTECYVFELINPLSANNLDTTVVVGTPKQHLLCSSDRKGGFIEREFDYVGTHTGMISGLTM